MEKIEIVDTDTLDVNYQVCDYCGLFQNCYLRGGGRICDSCHWRR